MLENTFNLKTTLNKLGEKCFDFFYGAFFPAILALIICVCYTLKHSILGLFICSLFASIIFVLYKDTTPIIPILFMVVLNFRDYSVLSTSILGYLTLIPAIIAFIARFFIYPIKEFKRGSLFFSLILLTASYLLSGIGFADYVFFNGLAPIITLGPVMLIIYLFFSHTINPPKKVDIKWYLCYVFIVTALTITMHTIVANVETEKKVIELGWANVNSAATFLCFAIPACYYLITTSKNVIPWLFVLIFFYASFVIVVSDAVLGLTVAITPILVVYTYLNIRPENKNLFTLFVIIGIILILITTIVVFYTIDLDFVIEVVKKAFTDNGRTELYDYAIELFKNNPIFGVGAGFIHPDTDLTTNALRVFNFHSTFFHVLATMGILGLVAYAFYFYKRLQILMKKYNSFTYFALVAFILFESYGMVDTAEFNAIPLMSALIVMLVIVELTNKDNDYSLPLATKIKNYSEL